jgi:hypothetical protein
MFRNLTTTMILVASWVLPASADNGFEVSLFKDFDGISNTYGVAFDAEKPGFTTCTLETPSGASDCGSAPDGILVVSGLTNFDDLKTGYIGSGPGTDWTLTWDITLGTETKLEVDFGTVNMADWHSLPTITNPADGATGVSANTSIDWTWPASPTFGNIEVSFLVDCGASDSPDLPPNTTTWTPGSPLTPGIDCSVVVSNSEDILTGLDGLTITGDPWEFPEQEDWLDTSSIDISNFDVIPEPSTALLFALGLVGTAAVRRRRTAA